MTLGVFAVVVILTANLALVAVLMRRPGLLRMAGGHVLVFLGLLVLPALAFAVGFGQHTERAKRTEFCVSCHVMEPYGASLWIDSTEHLPATHVQNARVDQDRACYVCHTSYTMFGGLQAKLNGLQHLYVNYVSGPPDRLQLYQPYQNRECLFCHGEARSFVENDLHADLRGELDRDEVSCLECHDRIHDVGQLTAFEAWEPGRE